MDNLWQSPFVNVFKHYNLSTWKKATKEGDVTSLMDKNVKGTIYRITGSVPAGNFIQLPKTNTQSLGLTGRYFYLLFKPIPSKHFVVHLDIATADNLVIRVSFSNLFKAFKSTSTWLQFPFVCSPPQGPIPSYVADAMRGLTMVEAKRHGLTAQGICPLPRDMTYPVAKGEQWHDLYDWIRFPTDSARKPFDSIQLASPRSRGKSVTKGDTLTVPPKRIQSRTVDVRKCVTDRVSMIHKLTRPSQPPKYDIVTKEVPEMPLDLSGNYTEEIHVYAHPDIDKPAVTTKKKGASAKTKIIKEIFPQREASPNYKSLEPDPIMKLKRIIGFGGATFQDVLWSSDGHSIVYPCNAIVVSMRVTNGHQRFFIGHIDKVSCLALTTNSSLLASGQTGQISAVRVWKYSSGECLAISKAHVHSLSCLSFSSKGMILCGVGKDGHGKNLVVIWNTSRVAKSREISVLAKAHTDVDITRIVIAPFDDTKMVSCGRDNVRLWRIKEGSLRSGPVNLGEYHAMEFTDVSFESCSHLDMEPEHKLFYACTKSGHIFEIDYNKLNVHRVRRLLPLKNRPGKNNKVKTGTDSGGSMSINSMHLNETFCVTGSDDGFLRLWPLDFAHVYLEAEHEGPVTAARLSADGLKILAGTSTGNLGILDVSTRQYTTLMRSHTGRILCFAVDPKRKHLATVSEDHTIRVWDADTLQQLYDFSASEECPCTINYHPTKQIFACGFHNGSIRVFNVETTTLVAEHKQLRGQVTGLVYSPDGTRLYSCCSLGVAALNDSSSPVYSVIRVVSGLVARGEQFGPQALAISQCGRRLAFVGPTEFTVTVADARCMDELVRIDVSGLSVNTSKMDSADRVTFSPARLGHLLVTTANNRLIKYDAKNGRLIQETDHIHRSGCSAISVSSCGQYMATGGDKTIKIWDYGLQLDINCQVFIGHSENVSRIHFTPDGLGLISSGEAIYLWDFLVKRPPTPPIEGRMILTDIEEVSSHAERDNLTDEEDFDAPRPRQTFPRSKNKDTKSISPRSDDIDGLSSIHGASDVDEPLPTLKASTGSIPHCSVNTSHNSIPNQSNSHAHWVPQDNLTNGAIVGLETSQPFSATDKGNGEFHTWSQPVNSYKVTPTKQKASSSRKSKIGNGVRVPESFLLPAAFSHYKQREKKESIAQRRYTAPPNQAGLKLKSVIGFNSNGRNNMVWHPDMGLFAYSSGCVIVLEDLKTGEQKYLQGHTEEVSSLALQHDSQCLVSASPAFKDTPCQVCVWDTQTRVCRKVLSHHRFGVQCLSFSRDDRFLISVGDYRECNIVVWDTNHYHIVASSVAAAPIHALKWDPFTVNEFVSVGEQGTVLFWLLDETSADVCLNVHEAELPEELDTKGNKTNSVVFTSLAYAGDSTVYIGTDSGKVSAWDTRHNTCFMHWNADSGEITKIISRHNRLMTAGISHTLKLWAMGRVGSMKSSSKSQANSDSQGLTMEDEMALDGAITCAEFDDTLDMGIVGTVAGTLWYINWAERTSIRLVSGHKNKINGVAFTPNNLLMSGGDDGSVRVWSLESREQALQFQVMQQSCTCLAAGPGEASESSYVPLVAGGYSDGTVRVFDVNKVEMVLKMHPHAVAVTAIAFSADGMMILSGGSDGLIAVSSPMTGMTVRVINDHRGVAISNIDVTLSKNIDVGITAPTLWLASSMDRRVSVWSADWAKDFCELVDWLTFPAPAFMPDGSRIKKNDSSHYYQLPPTLAKFSPDDADSIVYTGYGMEKSVNFYSLSQRKVVRTVNLTHWSSSLDVSPDSALIAVGISERLLKLMDYQEGSFQDFTGHSDGVSLVQFSPSGTRLLTASHNELFLWEVLL